MTMDPKKTTGITRRDFAKGLALVATATGGGLALHPLRALAEEVDALVTEFEANKVIIDSLAYVNESPNAEQQCAGCVLYTGPAEGLGKCGLFQQGKVPAGGWCKSWAAKPQA